MLRSSSSTTFSLSSLSLSVYQSIPKLQTNLCSIESRLQLLVVVQGLAAIHTLVGNLMLHAVARRGLDPVSRRAASLMRAGGLRLLGAPLHCGWCRPRLRRVIHRWQEVRRSRSARHATGWGWRRRKALQRGQTWQGYRRAAELIYW